MFESWVFPLRDTAPALVTPDGATELRRGDVLTLLGGEAAVGKARALLSDNSG